MTRNEQFSLIEIAEKKIFEWCRSEGIKLFKIEVIVPFVKTDLSLGVFFFYTRERLIKMYENNGTSNNVKDKFLEILSEVNYPPEYLSEVEFYFDSHENVKKNYNGSYFLRMR